MEATQPKISVIIPAYNTAHLIANCLDSVFAQSWRDLEVIVVNDGSPDTDKLEQVLQPYQEHIVYIKQANKRAAGARNTAIHKARGEFLAFLDSDDLWLPGHLTSQMALLQQDATLDMVYADALVLDDRPWKFMDKCPSKGPASFEALALQQCQISVSTVVVRKSALVRAGLFDESLLRCDDYDMWLRTAFHGAKIGYSRNLLVHVSGARPGSLGEFNAKMIEAYWIILDKASRDLPLPAAERDLVRKQAQEIRTRYLIEEGKLQLEKQKFDDARRLFAEANRLIRQPKLALALLGLKIAPGATSRLFCFWSRIRDGARA